MLASILQTFGFDPQEWVPQPFGTGLINRTWLLKKDDEEYILQQVNDRVFKNPYAIAENTSLLSNYLTRHFPEYFFVTPILSVNNTDLEQESGGYYRVFPFIKDAVSYTVAESPELAFEAATQFGKFTHLLAGFNETALKETLPGFHNLSLRHRQFTNSLVSGNKKRISEAAGIIEQIEKHTSIVNKFEQIKNNPKFRKRVTHHDTKISNVLFNRQNKGLCVIDLDTVMPGFFISDVGDMMRTYLAAVSEEEKDFSIIEVREDFFAAIAEGYLSQMQADLSEEEQQHFIYAGKFMVYMQCIRFLTDYFMNDVYYGSAYEEQNLVRATNQLYLLNSLEEKEEPLLQKIKRRNYF